MYTQYRVKICCRIVHLKPIYFVSQCHPNKKEKISNKEHQLKTECCLHLPTGNNTISQNSTLWPLKFGSYLPFQPHLSQSPTCPNIIMGSCTYFPYFFYLWNKLLELSKLKPLSLLKLKIQFLKVCKNQRKKIRHNIAILTKHIYFPPNILL